MLNFLPDSETDNTQSVDSSMGDDCRVGTSGDNLIRQHMYPNENEDDTNDENREDKFEAGEVEEDYLEQENHICHRNHKASQTCLCALNRLNETEISNDLNSAAPDSTGRLEDLKEEEEEEDAEHPAEAHNNLDGQDQFHMEQNKTRQSPSLAQPNPQDQIRVLRDLLRLERENCERRRRNNVAMQHYVQQLQIDFLRQQRELVDALELTNKLKSQKDSQLAIVEATLIEKDRLIEQLRSQLNDLDEAKLRSHFKETLEKQQQLARLEEEQLKLQMSQLDQQLAREKATNCQLAQQFEAKLEDQTRVHERELSSLRSRLVQCQKELEQYLNEPQNLVIRSLKEDNAKLENQLNDTNLLLNDSRTKYDTIKRKLECLQSEQEQSERQNQEEWEKLQQVHLEQRQNNNELKLELEDKQEVIQILQFNLQRSEKRVRNLIGLMKSKEETYRQLVCQIEAKHEHEFGKVKAELSSLQQQSAADRSEIMKKQNELVRLRLEHDNQLESMRNDRDERLNKCSLEKQRIEKELQNTEMRVARELELVEAKSNQINQLRKEVTQFKEESKRLLIELTKSEAKLYSKQREFNELLEKHKGPAGCSERESSEAEQGHSRRLTLELEEERRISNRYKNQLDAMRKEHEKMCVKLRIAETNLIKMTSSINREHAKMLRDYEKKIEQIRSEQVVFDRNKLRYKRYGYKLKKYCEHLRKVHDHICNPNVCGYLIGSPRGDIFDDGTKKSTSSTKKPDNHSDEDKKSLLRDSDGCYSGAETRSLDYSDLEELCNIVSVNNNVAVGQGNLSESPCPQKDKFKIKRTGVSTTTSAPTPRTQPKKMSESRYLRAGTHLKPIDPNVTYQKSSYQQQQDEQHDYCYINEGSLCSREGRAVI